MWQNIKGSAIYVHQTFHKSGVIWFARLQVLIGAIWAALTAVDLAPIIGNPKYVTAWLVFSGIVTEYSRRSGTYQDRSGHLLPRDPNLTVVVNNEPSAAPAAPVPTDGTSK
jgi:hypothetical protein